MKKLLFVAVLLTASFVNQVNAGVAYSVPLLNASQQQYLKAAIIEFAEICTKVGITDLSTNLTSLAIIFNSVVAPQLINPNAAIVNGTVGNLITGNLITQTTPLQNQTGIPTSAQQSQYGLMPR